MPDASMLHDKGWTRPVAAALLATLVGIGLARFAYSPLIPMLIGAGWLAPAGAAYLGAANLAGYLLGALAGQRATKRWPVRSLLRAAMLLAAASFLASAWPPLFAWLFGWRLASGVAGGVLMVLAAPSVLPRAPAGRRGLAAGIVFSGVGIGVVISGTLVPALVAAGPTITWLALGLLSLAATCFAWTWWPQDEGGAAVPGPSEPLEPRRAELTRFYLIYGLVAVGLVPHMVFLVDLIARGLGAGLVVGGRYWIVFGLGALVGPILAGRLADSVGFEAALRSALLLQVVCVALPALTAAPLLLILSSLVIGGSVSGTVPLALGRIQEILGDPNARRAAWSTATIFFAVGQASAGYAYSAVFALTGGDYRWLFALGAGAVTLAFALSLVRTPAEHKCGP